MQRTKTFSLSILCAFFVIGAVTPLIAEPKDLINYRKGVMKAVSGHAKALKSIAKGKVERKADLKAHARAMVELATMSATLFPKGTGPETGKTRALPAIWEKKAEYDKINDDWLKAAKSMDAAADAGNWAAANKAIDELSKACGACHKKFRKKKAKKKKS